MCGNRETKNQAGNIKRMKNETRKNTQGVGARGRQWPRPTRTRPRGQRKDKGKQGDSLIDRDRERQGERVRERAYICLTQHKNESKSYKKKSRVCVRRGNMLRTSLAGAATQKDSSMAIPKFQAKVLDQKQQQKQQQQWSRMMRCECRANISTLRALIPTLSPQRGLSE